jgi:glycerophosphoryl diester phosphodiesterase
LQAVLSVASRHTFHGVTKVIGHRGAPRMARENTVAAFRAAAEAGADMVELDVRRTADGALVVHHDAALDDGRLIVETLADALPQWLPALDHALDACAGMTVNVEIKNSPRDPDYDEDNFVAADVVDVIDRAGWPDRVVVSTFNLGTIDAVRAATGAMATGWLVLPGMDLAAAIDTTAAHDLDAIHPYDTSVTPASVVAAHAAGLQVNVWTVDDPDRMVELAAWGVDGIVTNVPDVAVRVLRHH